MGADSHDSPSGGTGLSAGTPDDLKTKVIDVLRTCFDPEIPVNIYELGLIYKVNADPGGAVKIEMTLTSPGCPSGAEIMEDARRVVAELDGVTGVEIELVWEPFWTPERMDPRVKAFLGY